MMMRDLAYLKLLAKEYPTVKEATSEIVNLTAICSLPPPAFFIWYYPGEDQRDLRPPDSGGGAGTAGQLDLLSGAESGPYDETGALHRGLAENHHLPPGTELQGGVLQVHSFQGAQEDAQGICLHH